MVSVFVMNIVYYVMLLLGAILFVFYGEKVIFVAFNGSVKSILDLVGSYISYFVGPAAGAFILAMFTKKQMIKELP